MIYNMEHDKNIDELNNAAEFVHHMDKLVYLVE